MQIQDQIQVNHDCNGDLGRGLPEGKQGDEQDSSVSSAWMTELLQECLCNDHEYAVQNSLLPKAKQIEDNVKVSS